MKMIVWALFDSGNGCYAQAAKDFEEIEIYSIGMDIQRKHNHFINLNLADYGRMFGDNTLFDTLDQLPQPGLIIASPPCESWSNASSMRGGNASWKQERHDSLFEPQTPLSRFTVRDYKDYTGLQFKPEKSLMNRINGELCVFNLIQIIKRYKPKYYVIENPAFDRIWEYINRVLGFEIKYENLAYYGNYGYPLAKPTKFGSNINLLLKGDRIESKIKFNQFSRNYNERSNIPLSLIKDIYSKILNYEKSRSVENE